MLLQNKVILVTGSTTGIGAAIAEHCVEAGAKVMLHGRHEERAKALAERLGVDNAAYCLADLVKPEGHVELINATVKKFGRIDSLVNNAARYPRNDIDSINNEAFDAIMDLNVRAPLFLTHHAVKHFRKQGGGTVVNIGSINAHCGQSDILIYSMSKGALMTMTRNLGNALGHENIRVNQLNVGWTLTENESELKQSEGFPVNWEGNIPKTYAPSGRLLRPDDVAKHVIFWASDLSAPSNGVVYELEQYPVVGRNLINEIPLDVFKQM